MLNKDTIPNLIVEQVKKSIMEGKIKPGDILPNEQEIAKIMDVGKNSVREALVALEHMDIITRSKNSIMVNENVYQFFNKGISYHFIIRRDKRLELYEVRKVLETQIAKLAAERASEEDLAEIRKWLIDPEDDSISYDYEVINNNFHNAIAYATKNKLLIDIYQKIKELIQIINSENSNMTGIQNNFAYHKNIFSALQNGDSENAGLYMMEHINAIYKNQY